MTPEPDRLLQEQYAVVVDEYRFQVDLNWRRSQYFFVLNAAILAASLALLASSVKLPSLLLAMPFAVGLSVSLLAIAANRTQKIYYYAIAKTKQALELRIGLGELAIRTTGAMGNRSLARLGRVTTFQTAVLLVLCVANLSGIAAAFLVDREADAPSNTIICIYEQSHPASTKAGNRPKVSPVTASCPR